MTFIQTNRPEALKAAGLPWDSRNKVLWAYRKRHQYGIAGAFIRQGRNIYVNVEAARELLSQRVA